jgi:hypothetical protein
MAVPSNQTNWQPTIPVDQSIYDEQSTQACPLGTKIVVGDRVYYYAQLSTSANVTAGRILCSTQAVASHQSGLMAIAAASAGQTVLSGTSSAAVAANFYAEGYFGAAAGTAAGQLYRVRGNAAGSTGFAFTLYDGLDVAITSGTTFALIRNPFVSVKVGSAVLDIPVGVAPIAVTTGNYFWMQTWGPAMPVYSGAVTAGAALAMGTLGAIVAARVATEGDGVTGIVLGKNHYLAATDAQNNPAYLTIRP